jgi:predicted transglutaminase-like cysteine proteinase
MSTRVTKTTRLFLFASPIGALLAGSIVFTHPDSFLHPGVLPIQPVALEIGKPAEFLSTPVVPPTSVATDTGKTANPISTPDAQPVKTAALESGKFSDGLNPAVPPARSAAIDTAKPVDKSRPRDALLFTAIVEDAKPPKGWDEFCARYRSECTVKTSAPRDITLTPDVWDTIVGVNDWANQHVKPMTDMKHWGKVNKWYYADDGYGDCKDYVLVKQRKLIEAGLPREALLIAIVWTKQNQGHAVLIVRTDKGEYALDNLSKQVLLWSKTPYDYVKRQTRTNPNAWVYIDGDPRKQPVTLANDSR